MVVPFDGMMMAEEETGARQIDRQNGALQSGYSQSEGGKNLSPAGKSGPKVDL
jgi:hypothetical protein